MTPSPKDVRGGTLEKSGLITETVYFAVVGLHVGSAFGLSGELMCHRTGCG